MGKFSSETSGDSLRRACSGDRSAFDCLATEHADAIRALIAIELGDGMQGRVEVDDLLQETWLRAFRSIEQFRGERLEEFRNWLAGIAHHAVLDRARRLSAQKVDYRREVPLATVSGGASGGGGRPWLEPPSPAASPSRLLAREERLERLLEAIQVLSPDHRQVVLLSLLRRLPRAEVARQMERSEKAVGMLLVRALRALREVFGETSSMSLPRDFKPRNGRGGAER